MNVCHDHQAKEEAVQVTRKKIHLESYPTLPECGEYSNIFVLKSIQMAPVNYHRKMKKKKRVCVAEPEARSRMCEWFAGACSSKMVLGQR